MDYKRLDQDLQENQNTFNLASEIDKILIDLRSSMQDLITEYEGATGDGIDGTLDTLETILQNNTICLKLQDTRDRLLFLHKTNTYDRYDMSIEGIAISGDTKEVYNTIKSIADGSYSHTDPDQSQILAKHIAYKNHCHNVVSMHRRWNAR